MIAATGRMAIHDFLLIACAVAAIVLSLCPEGDARQTLEVRQRSGTFQRYSFPVDDPRLARLRRDLAAWSSPAPDASLARHRWQAETADFYACRTEPAANAAPDVVHVSFSDTDPSAAELHTAKQLALEHAYWIRLGDEARQAIIAAESRLERQQMLLGPGPITFGDIIHKCHSPSMFAWASLMGLAVAGGFAVWTALCPTIRLRVERSGPQLHSATLDESGRLQELRLAIPAKWVRVHQPILVVVRQIGFAAVVAGGLVCLIL